jgi:hypothetical protein
MQSYTENEMQRRPGFCISFGHVERFTPETPCRNFNDQQEYIGLYVEQFLLPDGTFCTVLIIIGDNSKGPLSHTVHRVRLQSGGARVIRGIQVV